MKGIFYKFCILSLMFLAGLYSIWLFPNFFPQTARRMIEARAKAEATKDINSGRLIIKSFGLPVAYQGLARKKLRDECGVEIITVAGCVVTEEIVEDAHAYNAVSIPAIEQRFGEGIIDRIYKEAAEQFSKAHSLEREEMLRLD